MLVPAFHPNRCCTFLKLSFSIPHSFRPIRFVKDLRLSQHRFECFPHLCNSAIVYAIRLNYAAACWLYCVCAQGSYNTSKQLFFLWELCSFFVCSKEAKTQYTEEEPRRGATTHCIVLKRCVHRINWIRSGEIDILAPKRHTTGRQWNGHVDGTVAVALQFANDALALFHWSVAIAVLPATSTIMLWLCNDDQQYWAIAASIVRHTRRACVDFAYRAWCQIHTLFAPKPSIYLLCPFIYFSVPTFYASVFRVRSYSHCSLCSAQAWRSTLITAPGLVWHEHIPRIRDFYSIIFAFNWLCRWCGIRETQKVSFCRQNHIRTRSRTDWNARAMHWRHRIETEKRKISSRCST